MKLNRPPGPRLGELLEKRGRISREVLLNALRHQRTSAGRIGTCLLELEAIGEDDLLDVLSNQLKVPFVPPEELRSLPEEVVKLLPEKVARQRFAIPFRVSSTHLTVALRDPADLLALDEVAFVTGRRIRVQVTSELRILEALAKYYGVELAGRFTKLLDKINRERFLWSQGAAESAPPMFVELAPLLLPPQSPDLRALDSGELRAVPAARAPGVSAASGSLLAPIVSVYDLPQAAPAPAVPAPAVPAPELPPISAPPPPAAPSAPPASAKPSEHSSSAAEATSATIPSQATAAPAAASAYVTASFTPFADASRTVGTPVVLPSSPLDAPAASASAGAQIAVASAHPSPATFVPPTRLGLADAETRLTDSGGRDEIGQILMEFARPRAAAVLLLMVRRDEAAGWLGFGPGLDDESVESCRVDLRASSFVRALRDGATMHRGALPPLPAHAEIRAMLSTNWATDLLALPLRMRTRLVGVLVMTLEEGEFAAETVEELTQLVNRASVALELVVLRQKLHTP